MRAGKLRHRVVLDEPVETQSATGEPLVDWTPRATVWASVEPLNGRESARERQIVDYSDTKIRVRWSATIDAVTPKWRVRHQATIYNIQSVAHIDLGRREVEIMVRAGLNDG